MALRRQLLLSYLDIHLRCLLPVRLRSPKRRPRSRMRSRGRHSATCHTCLAGGTLGGRQPPRLPCAHWWAPGYTTSKGADLKPAATARTPCRALPHWPQSALPTIFLHPTERVRAPAPWSRLSSTHCGSTRDATERGAAPPSPGCYALCRTTAHVVSGLCTLALLRLLSMRCTR